MKTKFNFYICLWSLCLFISFLSSKALAQQQEEEKPKYIYSDEGFPRLKWDFSTDIQFLLRDNQTQGDVLIRKNKVKRLKTWGMRYSAMRYRVQFHHNKTTADDRDGRLTQEDMEAGNYSYLYSKHTTLQSTDITLAVGYEWQKYFGRFMVHYGSDLNVFRRVNESEYAYYYRSADYLNNKEVYKDATLSKSNSIGIAIAPLLGVRYFIHPMISFTAETQLNIGRASVDHTYLPPVYNDYWYEGVGNSRDKTTYINYVPVSFVGVTVHLGK